MTTYYAYHFNGLEVTSHNLADLAQLPDIDYIIKQEGAKNTVINADGSIRFYNVGGFELRDISTESYTSNVQIYTTYVTLCELRTNTVHQVQLRYKTGYGRRVFDKQVRPLLELLEELGSVKAYELVKENKELNDRIVDLTNENAELREQLPEFRN